MRKTIVILGLIILVIAGFPLILGLGVPLGRFPRGESRLPIPMILLFVVGAIITIVGAFLSPSKKEGNGFRMKY